MRTFNVPAKMYRSTFQEIIKMGRSSPQLTLLGIGVAGLSAAAFLMLLLVAVLA
jgi:hypothetical protein